MFTPLTRALEQFDDPAILAVLLKTLMVSIACFAALILGSVYGIHHVLAPHGWLAWVASLLGGAASLAASLWLFLPVAIVIASAFMEPVCRAVERRWYPGLPMPQGASLPIQIWDGLVVAGLVLVLNLVSLLLALLIPGIGLLLGWAITAWALGRGLFVAVAMRRMSRMDAGHLYLRHRGGVLLQGAALALAGSIPVLNLLLPVLGPACMVHVLMQRVPAS
jgi:CysZ protein